VLTLRPDQEAVKAEVYANIRSGNARVCVQAMTSFGKTALAGKITLDALSRETPVIFTAPMITLVDQTYEEFKSWGIDDIGIIQADHPYKDYGANVQICSIQSIAALMKRDMQGWEEYQKGKLIIHDETHVWHQTHAIMSEIADKPVIGLSASPWRKGLGKVETLTLMILVKSMMRL